MRIFSVKTGVLLMFGLMLNFSVVAQQQQGEDLRKQSQKYMQEAEKAKAENDFPMAEASYRKAIAKDPDNDKARYNMGNLYYTRENTPGAESRYKEAAKVGSAKEQKHKSNHNLGNAFMKQKKYQEAVEAYKNALRNDPSDDETRYNLALAKKMLEQQQQNQDENQDGGDNENEDQDNKDQEENQDQQNKDKDQQDDQKNKDGEGDNEGDQDQQDKDKEEKEGDKEPEDQEDGKDDKEKKEEEPGEGQKQPQPTQGQLSPQQIQSLLEAMNNEERKVQEKMNAEKQKGSPVKSEKDW